MEKNDTYLITGATGQLWPMVLKSLIQEGIDPEVIHLLVRSKEKAKRVFETHGIPEMPTIIWDITEGFETLKWKIPPEITHIVNMAGSVKFWEASRTEVERVNLQGAITMAKLALAQWRLTHVSTSYILGRVDTELTENFIGTETVRKPKNPYEEAKWNAEVAIGQIFAWQREKLQIVRPSILTDAIARPDLWWELHAAMWYYAPFIHLRKSLNERWIKGWVDLEWFEFAGNYDNPINIIDNKIAGEIIGKAIIEHKSRALNVVSSTPPAYGDLTNYVLETLQLTGYSINGRLIQHGQTSIKIGNIEQWRALKRVIESGYNRNSKPNYFPYATHNSRFAGGIELNNKELAASAVKALLQ